jgi:uncharacterized membrane protein YedE/YeeE
LGLIVGALLIEPLGFTVLSIDIDRALPLVAVGGLLIGFGTTISGGCTSGHGICGMSRLSRRSILATILFIAAGVLSVAVINYYQGAVS